MKSPLLPYASTPGRLSAQLFSDTVVAVWTTLWVLVGWAVHRAISVIADVGSQVEAGAHGVAGNLASAGDSADRIPLVGDAVSKPLTAASSAALEIAGAGHNLATTAGWLAVVLAFAVAAPPTCALAAPWLVLRLRFFRRKRAVLALAATAGGEQLLALRALSHRPLRRLAAISPDPVGGWRHQDPYVIAALAALELRSAGFRRDPVR